jgi:hypothetical protein
MKLTEILHDAFLNCGEILPAAHITQIIQEFEFSSDTEHDSKAILKAIRYAGEWFVDSMRENERDTEREVRDGLYCGHPIKPLDERLEHWEAMRPSATRQKAIATMINAAK